MTCREKLKIEYPEAVHPDFVGGCRDCPCTYGYLGDSDECDGGRRDEVCRKCWDREIPGTQPLEQNDDQLKPCPFCGGEAEIHYQSMHWEDGVCVRCTKCNSRSQFVLFDCTYMYFHGEKNVYVQKERAVNIVKDMWNRRV